MTSPTAAQLRRCLLAWYDSEARELPWRAPPGSSSDPYQVWISEIMLQQTGVATVIPYFNNFVARWPTVQGLAAAGLDQVLHAWQGLGYYARARNLHKCAIVVARELSGCFPDNETDMRRLPGIGTYTAAAMAAIAFSRKATPVDGNVIRVTTRLYAVSDPLPGARVAVGKLAARLTPAERPGDFAQAMMDLGATVCTPRKPTCDICPWRLYCKAYHLDKVETYPVPAEKKEKPVRRGIVFWVISPDGSVLLRRRPENGLLGGLMEFPSTEWREGRWTAEEARPLAPAVGNWRQLPGLVRHVFTHFHLELEVWTTRSDNQKTEGVWCQMERLSEHALPTVMKKVARHVQSVE